MNGDFKFNKKTFISFMKTQIVRKKEFGCERTSEAYASTLNSFIRFRKNVDIKICDIDSDLMRLYESYLIKCCHLTKNSTSFYMRILRAVYNNAVERGFTKQRQPFKYVYTGVDKTVKRALPLRVIKKIKDFDLSSSKSVDFARDMFMFSFYTRGMSFVDMAYLKKTDLRNGILTYRRRKTKQQLFIKWEKCMQEIVDKYPINDGQYLLPIISSCDCNERLRYRSVMSSVNMKLKPLGESLKLPFPLTMYVARHSWASVARSKNVPISIISEAMGHDSEATTQIYLASIETTVVDRVNHKILKSLL